MTTPTEAQIEAGMAAGRKMLQDYSAFASMEVPDDALRTFTIAILTAGLSAGPHAPQGESHA